MRLSTIELAPPVQFIDEVTTALLDWERSGLGGVLVTLVGIEGAAPRPLGSQMAVNERGDWVGQISSECAEAAIAREALAALQGGRSRTVRYGRGSKYIDVRLPCGSGLDVHFDPCVPFDILEELEAARRNRHPVALHVPWRGEEPGHTTAYRVDRSHDKSGAPDDLLATNETGFLRHYLPTTRVVVAGKGPHASALIGFAHALGWEVCLSTPDEALIAQHANQCRTATRLTRASEFNAALSDPWTATVLLFHDHAWEPPILARALAADGFYIGALGSRATHAKRTQDLERLGVAHRLVERVRGPVGLDIGACTPPEIALSIVAEIVAARHGR